MTATLDFDPSETASAELEVAVLLKSKGWVPTTWVLDRLCDHKEGA